MDFDFEELDEKFGIILILKKYVMTADGNVYRKQDNGRYTKAALDDKAAEYLNGLTSEPRTHVTYLNRTKEKEER